MTVAPDSRDNNLMNILTPTQFKVTILVGSGLKNREVARLMNTTGGVVKNFLRDIFARAAVSNRVELALRYTEELETGMYDRARIDHEIAELESRAQQLSHRG